MKKNKTSLEMYRAKLIMMLLPNQDIKRALDIRYFESAKKIEKEQMIFFATEFYNWAKSEEFDATKLEQFYDKLFN